MNNTHTTPDANGYFYFSLSLTANIVAKHPTLVTLGTYDVRVYPFGNVATWDVEICDIEGNYHTPDERFRDIVLTTIRVQYPHDISSLVSSGWSNEKDASRPDTLNEKYGAN
jgi:hypothetical protein